jgi:NADH dehydrogenase/NADH:ubiquinone oxidoreductase subunit G
MNTLKVFIDNQVVFVPKFSSILQACSSMGIELPRFCYHPLLKVAGNCRMCLVEVEKGAKPQMGCAFPVLGQTRIFLNSPLVNRGRENMLELNLANHPLDCPICDQGGECDLQDQSFEIGGDKGRFSEIKRSIHEDYLGLGIKSLMTRCIACTRCVRYVWEWLPNTDLETDLRGSHMSIQQYKKKSLEKTMSGNLVDLCPVGGSPRIFSKK